MSERLPIRVLLVEDNPADAEFILDELRQSGFEPEWERVETKAEYLARLTPTLDVILADYNLPQFNGLTALKLLQEHGLDIPFILVSGSIGEELAVTAIQNGAADYMLKDRLIRLGPSVKTALESSRLRLEKRQAEEMLRESEARYRTLVEQAADGIFMANSQGHYIDVNSAGCRLLGYSRKEILEKGMRDLTYVDSNQPLRFEELRQGKTLITQRAMIRKDGTHVPVEISSKQLPDGNLQGIVRDITERKQIETERARERTLLRTLIDSLPDRIYAKDSEGRFTLKNQADASQMGVASPDEVIGKTDFDYYPVEIAEQYAGDDKGVISSGQALINREEHVVAADGTQGWMLTSKFPLRDDYGTVIGLVGIGRDITERKIAETRLRRLNRTLALLSDVNQAIIRRRTSSELFETVCRIAVTKGDFRMAWIGILDSVTQQVNSVAHAGIAEDYLKRLEVFLNDTPRGHGPAATAFRTGNHVIVNDIEHDPRMTPWREDALSLGYRAVASLIFKVAGEMRGIFVLYADAPEFFDDEELKLLDEMAADIGFAMEFAENETQRQQAEKELKDHMQMVEGMRLFLQTTLDAFPANTAVLSSDGTIINVNAPWVKFADANGASSSLHYIGQNYLTVCDMTEGESADHAASTVAGIRAVIDGSQEEFYLEYPCHSPFEKRWFAVRVTPFPELAPRSVVVAHINITERKLAEENLENTNKGLEQRVIDRTAELQTAKERVEAILNSATDAILLVHNDLIIEQTNASFDKMFGCNPDDYFGRSLNLLFHSSDADFLTLMGEFTGVGKNLTLDVKAQRKDGSVFAAEVSLGIFSNDSFLCTIHDINARKELEQSLQATIAKEKELNELKTRFVSMASHEFRTPLATISAATETLSAYRHKLSDDQIDQKLKGILGQITRLTDIMDDVLRLARLQARRVEFKPELCDFDALCREIIDEYQSQPNISHRLLYELNSPVPRVQLDKKLMRQIIGNLLSNAIKYSPENKAVLVKLEYLDEVLIFSVHDNGIGIPEADLSHIFEPFHRATNVGTIQGTGLGLVIAKESVDLHGGTITVTSGSEIGTTFTVGIPFNTQGA